MLPLPDQNYNWLIGQLHFCHFWQSILLKTETPTSWSSLSFLTVTNYMGENIQSYKHEQVGQSNKVYLKLRYWTHLNWCSRCITDFVTETRTTRTPAFWDTPHRHMITHTNDSHQIPSQNKTKLQIYKIAKNSNFEILQETLHATHLLKLLDKMYEYEMNLTRTVGATERTWDAGRTDGRTEWNQYTPQQLRCVGV